MRLPYILPRPMPRLNKTIMWFVEEYLFDLILHYVVLDSQFLHNVRQPEKIINVHKQTSTLTCT